MIAGMDALRLWSDELEHMRAEARATIAATKDAMLLHSGPVEGLTVEERVRREREMMDRVTFAVPEAEARDLAGVPCRILRADGDPRAVYLHFHGGGMVTGTATMMDIPNRDLAKQQQVTVVSVDYAKAPERPWPAGPDDGVAVARWLVDNAARELGSDRLLIGGESAGAYMTALVALRVRDEIGAIDRVIGLNLTFGVYDWSGTPSQRGARAHDGFDVLEPESVQFMANCYLPGRSPDERRAPHISPMYADLRGLPPCFVSVGTCDHLLDDSLLFASRAAAAGVDVELLVLPELPHAFQMFDCGLTREWGRRTGEWFAARLGS